MKPAPGDHESFFKKWVQFRVDVIPSEPIFIMFAIVVKRLNIVQ